MNLLENIKLSLEGLRANKMRAFLTMLGIIIGISSVVTINSLGNTMTNSISDAFQSLGGNNIEIVVGSKDMENSYGGTNETISEDMLNRYRQRFHNEIDAISLFSYAGLGSMKIMGSEAQALRIYGVNEQYATANGIELIKGRNISARDNDGEKNVILISSDLAQAIFGAKENPIGKEIKVDAADGNHSFYVVGVYKLAGSDDNAMMSMMVGSVQEDVYIPYSTAKAMAGDTTDGYSDIIVMAKQGVDSTAFAQTSADFFNPYFENTNAKVYAQSMESMLSQMTSMLNMVSVAIAVIAGISLLVGGIGVMNIMLVSVTERTREIGIRKALGAPNTAIRIQFIVESIIICIIGGLFGILFSILLGALAGALLNTSVVPTPQAIIVAVLFSMAIGVFFGYYPANKAAKLNPIDALRYE